MSDGFEGTEQRPSVSNDYQRVATFRFWYGTEQWEWSPEAAVLHGYPAEQRNSICPSLMPGSPWLKRGSWRLRLVPHRLLLDLPVDAERRFCRPFRRVATATGFSRPLPSSSAGMRSPAVVSWVGHTVPSPAAPTEPQPHMTGEPRASVRRNMLASCQLRIQETYLSYMAVTRRLASRCSHSCERSVLARSNGAEQ